MGINKNEIVNIVFDSDEPWGLYDKMINSKREAKVVVYTNDVRFVADKIPMVDGEFVNFQNANIYRISGKNLKSDDFPMRVKSIHVKRDDVKIKKIYESIGL